MRIHSSLSVYRIGALSLSLCCLTLPLRGADLTGSDNLRSTVDTQSQTIDIQNIKEIDKEFKTMDIQKFSHGVWFSSSYRLYRNLDHDKERKDFLRSIPYQDLRLWMSYLFNPQTLFYARGRASYGRPDTGPDNSGNGEDFEGPHLENLFIHYTPPIKAPFELAATLGRQFLYMGRGIVSSDIYDAVRLETTFERAYAFGFISKTLPHADNLDFSAPDFRKDGRRFFWGGEAGFFPSRNTSLYAYALFQRDDTDSDSNPAQNYRYDSEYYGAGLTHSLSKEWNLWFEGIAERGESHIDRGRMASGGTSDIRAWAYLAGIKVEAPIPLRPALELEQAYGSGDEDRTSVTNTKGGDLDGRDKNFLHFGTYFGGYALSPRLSNVHVTKLSFSFKPLYFLRETKELACGAKFFLYRKDEPGGGISDIFADAHDSDIGQEIDLFVHWKLTDHLKATTRFGLFYPGGAFPSSTDAPIQYLFLRLTLSY